jgi:hypothetical protein
LTAKRPKSLKPSPAPIVPETKPKPSFIVDQILPKFETHLVGGPSHSGKTTLMFQTIERWRTGKDVFGHESYPAPFCYLACECSSGTVKSTLSRVGIDPETFPFASIIEYSDVNNFDAAYALASQIEPKLEVLFIDGIHRICGGKSNDDQAVGNFLAAVNRQLADLELTVIGVGNSTKVKGDEKFLNPRERFRGSGAWGTGTRTMIVVERARNDELRDPKRTVMVIPTNAPDQVLSYSLDAHGLFQPDIEEPTRFDEFAEMITCREPGDEITRQELLEIASYVGDEGIPERTVNRYIERMVEEGRLKKAQWGRYALPLKN